MDNSKHRIVFVSFFSNKKIRSLLKLKSWIIRNFIFKILDHPKFQYSDTAVWVSDFIEQFEKHPDFEYHILSVHSGMCQKRQNFYVNDIHYHFLKFDYNLVLDTLIAKFFRKQRDLYVRKSLNEMIEEIDPQLVVICGAENPFYSTVALEIRNKPIYLLLQTVLNNPQLSLYNIGDTYRIKMEELIFKKVHYFGTSVLKYYSLYKRINPDSICLPIKFPSHKPQIQKDICKEFDFLYYGQISKNKGVEDLIIAMTKVVAICPDAKLCIIGELLGDYGAHLNKIITDSICMSHITIIPRFSSLDDLHYMVQKAHCIVLPSITGFNSTIRESMLMNLPVIVYETEYIRNNINIEKECLLAANLNDIEDLSKKMIFAKENMAYMQVIASNGKEYAEREFNNDEIGSTLIENFHAIIDNYKYNIPIPSRQLLDEHQI